MACDLTPSINVGKIMDLSNNPDIEPRVVWSFIRLIAFYALGFSPTILYTPHFKAFQHQVTTRPFGDREQT